ncbi:MAG: tyrosine--tRNA ligase [Phenylobacterium sp.]|nr:tyrosine--tRNA ligase [Phenylobacterium sp.]
MSLEIAGPAVLEPGHRSPEQPMTAETPFKSEFLQTMRDRGYIHQITHPAELDAAAADGKVVGYIGFDATAASLHVGSLIQVMMLRRLQKAGGKPIVVMGGGTTKVGDPSDKDAQRPLLTTEQIQANIASIKTVFEKFLTFGDGPTDAVMVDNAEWLDRLGYVEFLREFGVHFTINRMLAFDSVKLRLDREQPLTFLEFNYMLMQAVDFLELERRFGTNLQLGGSDQWGNIVNGVELIRRVDGKPAFGLTTPLLSTASGAKMGKTVAGAVWLNADLRSPYDYWQFWRNTEDADVGRFLRLFTDLPLGEIARLEALPGAEINDAKKLLANEATRMLHGEDEAAKAATTAEATFERGVLSDDLPTVEFVWAGPEGDLTERTAEALVKEAGLASSMREARDLIQGGGIRINDEKPLVGQYYARSDALANLGAFKVQKGKKTIVLAKPI